MDRDKGTRDRPSQPTQPTQPTPQPPAQPTPAPTPKPEGDIDNPGRTPTPPVKP